MIYHLALRLRHAMYDHGFLLKSVQAEVPTLCVGNITVGGTGKTPHTEMILDLLQRSADWGQKNLAVLSRGYKRRSKGFRVVPADGSALEFGDEPLQMKRKNPFVTVAVDKKRVRGCELLVHPDRIPDQPHPAADLIILDDAFQYRRLRPTASIVLIDYGRPVFRDSLLPFGRLRDLRERLRAAFILIVSKCPFYMDEAERRGWAESLGMSDYDPVTCEGRTSGGRTQYLFFTCVRYCEPDALYPEAGNPRFLYSKRAILFTGIADDTPLRRYLSDKYQIIGRHAFPDHHKYSSADIRLLETASRKAPTAAMITTEKDAQRLRDVKKMPSLLQERLFEVPIKADFLSDEDRDIFSAVLLRIISGR